MKSKIKKQREYEKESFNARLQMEQEAQRSVAARLRLIELQIKNKGHIR